MEKKTETRLTSEMEKELGTKIELRDGENEGNNSLDCVHRKKTK